MRVAVIVKHFERQLAWPILAWTVDEVRIHQILVHCLDPHTVATRKHPGVIGIDDPETSLHSLESILDLLDYIWSVIQIPSYDDALGNHLDLERYYFTHWVSFCFQHYNFFTVPGQAKKEEPTRSCGAAECWRFAKEPRRSQDQRAPRGWCAPGVRLSCWNSCCSWVAKFLERRGFRSPSESQLPPCRSRSPCQEIGEKRGAMPGGSIPPHCRPQRL